MTYRDALKASLDMVEGDTIEVDGKVIHNNPVFPIMFTKFTLHLASVYAIVSDILCGTDFPDITIGDVKEEGEGLPSSVISVAQLLGGYGHSIRRTAMFRQAQNFMTWLMDEPIDEEGWHWYTNEMLSDKWNEYAGIVNKDR